MAIPMVKLQQLRDPASTAAPHLAQVSEIFYAGAIQPLISPTGEQIRAQQQAASGCYNTHTHLSWTDIASGIKIPYVGEGSSYFRVSI